MFAADIQRFEKFVSIEPNSGCWLWTGAITSKGYGSFRFEGRTVGAHRVAFTLFVGRPSDDLELDHICHTRCCVNPNHLQQVTRRENCFRIRRSLTCPRGHNNFGIRTGSRQGQRYCKTCANTQWRRSRAHHNP